MQDEDNGYTKLNIGSNLCIACFLFFENGICQIIFFLNKGPSTFFSLRSAPDFSDFQISYGMFTT